MLMQGKECMIVILAYFTRFSPKFPLKLLLRLNDPVFLHWISLNKIASAVNFQTSLQRQSSMQLFATKTNGQMISLGCIAFCIMKCKQLGDYCQIQIHVQIIAYEFHDLNIFFVNLKMASNNSARKFLCEKFALTPK